MAEFKSQTSGTNRSTNWATTTALKISKYTHYNEAVKIQTPLPGLNIFGISLNHFWKMLIS